MTVPQFILGLLGTVSILGGLALALNTRARLFFVESRLRAGTENQRITTEARARGLGWWWIALGAFMWLGALRIV